MMTTFVSVALGGALGAGLRYLGGLAVLRMTGPQEFPVAVLSINVIGSALMGLCVAFAAQRGMGGFGPFLMTGVLGGFTTFSAFSLETVALIERGATGQAAIYVALSVGLSVGGLMLGLWLGREVFA
ncbi:MAG: fluoride efflux transporter CrcB [Rhodobacteraceae bacterium]|nr:fluoride efflux transporter CrcB [Paracoccaceae bacterium]